MLFVCGIPSEAPVALVLSAAEELGVECLVFNQRSSHFDDVLISGESGTVKGSLRIQEREYPLSALSGVYNRMMDWQHIPENEVIQHVSAYQHRIRKSAAIHDTLSQWLEIADIPIMNRHSAMGSNVSKPYQAQFIRKAGFLTPTTLITNDPDRVRAFLKLHQRVIFKSISSVRSVVKELDSEYLKELDRIRYLPTQFQAYVPGTNIRVHVTGYEVHATEIVSEAVDYRYAGDDGLSVTMRPIELPFDIARRCLNLSALLELPLCGIDLKRTDDDQYYCFEVNPSPGYSYYQEYTGQPIAHGIVRYLTHLQ